MKKILSLLTLLFCSCSIFSLPFTLVYFQEKGLLIFHHFSNNHLVYNVQPLENNRYIYFNSLFKKNSKFEIYGIARPSFITEPTKKGYFLTYDKLLKNVIRYNCESHKLYKTNDKQDITLMPEGKIICNRSYIDKINYKYLSSLQVFNAGLEKHDKYKFKNKKYKFHKMKISDDGTAFVITVVDFGVSNKTKLVVCKNQKTYEIDFSLANDILHVGAQGKYILTRNPFGYILYMYSKKEDKYISEILENHCSTSINYNSNQNSNNENEYSLKDIYKSHYQNDIDAFYVPEHGVFVIKKIGDEYQLQIFESEFKNVTLLKPTCISENSPIGITNDFQDSNIKTIHNQEVILGSKYNDRNKCELKTMPAVKYFEKYLKPFLYDFEIEKGYQPCQILLDRHTGRLAVIFWKPETLSWAVCYIETTRFELECFPDMRYRARCYSDDFKIITGDAGNASYGTGGFFWKECNLNIIKQIEPGSKCIVEEEKIDDVIETSHLTGFWKDRFVGYVCLKSEKTVSFISTIEDGQRVVHILPSKNNTKALGINENTIFGTTTNRQGEHGCTWDYQYEYEKGLVASDCKIIPFKIKSKDSSLVPKCIKQDNTILANYFPNKAPTVNAYIVKGTEFCKLPAPSNESPYQIYGHCLVNDHIGGCVSGKPCVWKYNGKEWIPTILSAYSQSHSSNQTINLKPKVFLYSLDRDYPIQAGVRWISKDKTLACGQANDKPQIWIKNKQDAWIPIGLKKLFEDSKSTVGAFTTVQSVIAISPDQKKLLLECYESFKPHLVIVLELKSPVKEYFKID